MVVAARERLGWTGMDNNAADALWARAVGLALYDALPVKLPQSHLVALEGVVIIGKPKEMSP
jgi:hypothetical protein